MLQNIIGGLQGIVDHVMVGHFVGFAGNAAIGVVAGWNVADPTLVIQELDIYVGDGGRPHVGCGRRSQPVASLCVGAFSIGSRAGSRLVPWPAM